MVVSETRFLRESPKRPSIRPASPKISYRLRRRRSCRGQSPRMSPAWNAVSAPLAIIPITSILVMAFASRATRLS